MFKITNKKEGFFGSLFETIGGPLVGGALSLIGGERQNEANINAAETTSAFNAAEAQKNRDFQKRMSNTAHQREIKDLRKAGLNPILSVTGGPGASSPGGATASGVKPDIKDTLTPAVGAGIAAASAKSNIKLQKSEISVKERQKFLIDAQASASTAEAQLKNAQRLEIEGTTPKAEQEIRNLVQTHKNLSQDEQLKIQQRLINTVDIEIKKVKDKHDREVLAQLKTKMSEAKAKETFWTTVGPLFIYADKIVKSTAAVAAMAAILKAMQYKKNPAKEFKKDFDKHFQRRPFDFYKK